MEAKQNVIENIVPVLTRPFTPLFTVLLLVFLATMVWNRQPHQREAGGPDRLRSAAGCRGWAGAPRRLRARPAGTARLLRRLQLLLVISALVVDGVALAAIAARISEFGFTPNRMAALGENLILLINLAWTAWLYFRFLRPRRSFAALERWQIAYLPVNAVWAALAVVVFPPVFGHR